LVAAIGENQSFRVAEWHNPEIRQAKEMCFDGTVIIQFCCGKVLEAPVLSMTMNASLLKLRQK
jgi:hypothetical protein